MSLSVKKRFDVFKRDGFICQYCGSHPPSVILEVDHIHPKSKGGNDDMDNLITSCFDCNRGKGASLLTSSPYSVSEKLQILKEKKKQYNCYRKLMEEEDKRISNECQLISDVFSLKFHDSVLSEKFKQATVRKFIKELGFYEVKDAMYIAISLPKNQGNVISYFCGICWNKIRQKNNY